MKETYTFISTIYDVSKAKEIVKNKVCEEMTASEIQNIAPQIISNLIKGKLIMGTSVQDTEWALKNANLDEPVIWYQSPNFSMLIDGYHRMYKAYHENKGLKVQLIDTYEESIQIVDKEKAKKHFNIT